MAHFNFVIPSNREELLSEGDDYFVKSIIGPKELPSRLKDARVSLRDEGPEFILDNFDVFYSVLRHETSLPMDVVFKSYSDLHKAAGDLNKSLSFLLEDKSSINDELKQKYQNVMKMLVYIYSQTVLLIEQKNEAASKNQGLMMGRKKSAKNDDYAFKLNKQEIVLTLNSILQTEIGIFWDPPVVEENFLHIFAEICYRFLQNPSIKGEKETKDEVFNLIGTLIKTYNHTTTFVIRMAQMLKDHEHLVQCLTDGVKRLVEVYNCKGMIHSLIREITEWQTEEKFQDSQGSKFCAQFLTAMAVSMPSNLLPELLYLNKYLGHDSVTLRNSVLNVITEVILNVLTKHSLNKEETDYRDDFLNILFQHMRDTSAHVRSKVIQHWARLQQENAIPRHLVNEVLKNVIQYHLHEKVALVRKSACVCVTTFLEYNTYGSELSLTKMTAELEHNQKLLDSLKPKIEQAKSLKSEEMEADWQKLLPDLKKVVLDQLKKDDDADSGVAENNLDKAELAEVIRMYISDGKYSEALKIWKASADNLDDLVGNEDKDASDSDEDEENQETENLMKVFLSHIKIIYMQGLEALEGIRSGFCHGDFIMTEEDFQKYEVLRKKVEYLSESVEFLKLIDKALLMIVELLETPFISDMQEAVTFFIAAHKFNIDNAEVGIMAMLKMMQRNEQDRKDKIIAAFKTIYLETSSENMSQHSSTIVNRLISLVKNVPYENVDDLEAIISEWVGKGILDNNIIDMFWQYFTKRVSVSDSDSHASMELLRMAALSRRTIITRNLKLVTSIAFGEMGRNNLAFLGSACNFLAVAGRDRIDITSKDSPFKIAHEDDIFTELFQILTDKFFTLDEYYNHALSGAMEFLYKVCGKPDDIVDQFIAGIVEKIIAKISEEGEEMLDRFIYTRLCHLLGVVAVKDLDYLDETVYKELKRRENYRNLKNKDKDIKNKKDNKKTPRSKKNMSGSVAYNTSHSTAADISTSANAADDTNLEGAQAEDEDAEFILHVLERNTVTGNGLLAQLAPVIVKICEKPDIYKDGYLQSAAATALIRYMLVSSEFCMKNIQLLFTIFEKTKQPEIKISILVHLSDLLTRFPNTIEPWTGRMYERLKDPSPEIRKATFFTLSGLILRDMIRAHSNIHLMVKSLIDPDRELNAMGRTFFDTLAQKENNLYNVLPDIFSHLMQSDDVSDEQAKEIMKFLFEKMDKVKHMENLVDRFCSKFEVSEDIRHQRNIAYCLSLLTYNEKALRNLQEDFPMYKHLVHDPEIYASFKTIMNNCKKQQVGKVDLKPIVTEIEGLINSVFEQNGDQPMKPPPPPRSTRKKPRGRIRSKRKQYDSDDD